nr:hypothetical protein [uncultured Methanobrevibacter sp.]
MLLKRRIKILTVNVAVAAPDSIYPLQTKIILLIFPPVVSPKIAYPLLVKALETITIAFNGSSFSIKAKS